MLPRALSSSSQMLRSRRRRHTAPAPAPPHPATPASSARTTTAAPTRRDSFRIARDPASPASNQTETKQHRVSCSMLDRMEVQDSAQRIASPRSQQTASSTRDSLQLSIRSAMTQCVFSDVRSLAFHHALGRMCLCSCRPVPVLPCCEARGAAPFWLSESQIGRWVSMGRLCKHPKLARSGVDLPRMPE